MDWPKRYPNLLFATVFPTPKSDHQVRGPGTPRKCQKPANPTPPQAPNPKPQTPKPVSSGFRVPKKTRPATHPPRAARAAQRRQAEGFADGAGPATRSRRGVGICRDLGPPEGSKEPHKYLFCQFVVFGKPGFSTVNASFSIVEGRYHTLKKVGIGCKGNHQEARNRTWTLKLPIKKDGHPEVVGCNGPLFRGNSRVQLQALCQLSCGLDCKPSLCTPYFLVKGRKKGSFGGPGSYGTQTSPKLPSQKTCMRSFRT